MVTGWRGTRRQGLIPAQHDRSIAAFYAALRVRFLQRRVSKLVERHRWVCRHHGSLTSCSIGWLRFSRPRVTLKSVRGIPLWSKVGAMPELSSVRRLPALDCNMALKVLSGSRANGLRAALDGSATARVSTGVTRLANPPETKRVGGRLAPDLLAVSHLHLDRQNLFRGFPVGLRVER